MSVATALRADNYFDFADWALAPQLFFADEPVWAALDRLDRFFAALPPAPEFSAPPGVHLLGSVWLGEGVRIEPGAVLLGPVWVEAGATIRAGAYLRDRAVIGAGAIVGAHSEVKASILWPGAKAPHQNYVGDSVLGREVNLGAGTILSNVKNIGREISLRLDGETLSTGRRKLGAILGDDCKTGCNSVLNPGVLMGPGSVTYPNCSLRSGVYPPRTLIKVRQQQSTLELDRLRG